MLEDGRPKPEIGFSSGEFASPGKYKLYINMQINIECILKITGRHI